VNICEFIRIIVWIERLCGSIAVCGSAAVCGTASGTLCGSVRSSVRAVHAIVCGSADSSAW
jgi:hypothetical protein